MFDPSPREPLKRASAVVMIMRASTIPDALRGEGSGEEYVLHTSGLAAPFISRGSQMTIENTELDIGGPVMSYSFEIEFEQLEFPLISSEPDCGLLALGIDGIATIEVNDAEDGDWFVTNVQIDVVGSGKAGFFSIYSHNRDAYHNPLVCSFVEDALKKNATHLDEIEDEISVRRIELRQYQRAYA